MNASFEFKKSSRNYEITKSVLILLVICNHLAIVIKGDI